MIPNTAAFTELDSVLNYENSVDSDTIATIQYTFNDVAVGTCDITYRNTKTDSFHFYSTLPQNEEIISSPQASNVVFINIKKIIIGIGIIAVLLALIFSFVSFLNSYNFSPRKREIKQRRQKLHREARQAAKIARKNAALHRRHMKQRRTDYKRRRRNRPIHKK